MQTYVGTKVKMATTEHAGVYSDHLDISPEGPPFDSAFNAYLRRNFDASIDPAGEIGPDECWKHPRNYKDTSISFRDLPLDRALEMAKEIASRENVVLYLQRKFPEVGGSFVEREIIWHPDNWTPVEG
ncbi:MAG: hypothetical protein WC613_02210 [Candidatus Aenigmatarchaeota archaeon]